MIASDQNLLSNVIKAHQKAEDFRRDHTTNRYPPEFKDVVRKALESGLSAHAIRQATGVNLSTLCSWRKSLDEPKEILYFEPVKRKIDDKTSEMGRLILPSGIEIMFPMTLIKSHLVAWLSQDAA